MRIKRIISLLLAVCVFAGLFAGCDSQKRVDWNSYDESTRSLSLGVYSLKDKDIVSLRNLTGLTYLYLWDNKISDLTPFVNLINLTELHLGRNRISDLTPLANLTELKKIDLSDNRISDLTPLNNLTNLTELHLSGNKISDLTPLANLINLTALFLDGNEIRDLSPLANLKNLTYLSVRSNNIADWSPVAHVPDVVGNPGNATLLTENTAIIKTGRIYYISLSETQSIPMRWKSFISDESLVRLVCTSMNAIGLNRVFYFEALSPGECTIDMYWLSIKIDSDYDISQISPDRSYSFIVED